MIKIKLPIILMLTALIIFTALSAGAYEINWWSIDNGGGDISGGTYTMSGTIGQADASTEMTGGTYSLTGGFQVINLTANTADYWFLY